MYKVGKSSLAFERMLEQTKRPTIRNEVALMRALIEQTLAKAEDELEFVLQSDILTKQLDQLRKSIETFHKLEEASGNILHISEVKEIQDSMMEIIIEECNPKVIGKIAQRFKELLER